MSWVYSGTLPSIEDTSRYSAPPDQDQECDLSPYDQGFEDRTLCRDREQNPYSQDADRLEWLRGWDDADQLGEEVER